MDGAISELADSHFRIDPYADSASFRAAARFVRTPGLADRRALSLRLSGDPGAYLMHDNGRLTIGPPRRRVPS